MYKATIRGFSFLLCLVGLMIALPTIGVGNNHTFSDDEVKATLMSCAAIFIAGAMSTAGEKDNK